MSPSRPSAQGFALVEALVALALAAGTLALFYDGLGAGTRLSSAARTEAAMAAEAFRLLDETAVVGPLRAGADLSGRSGALAWRVRVTEMPPPGSPALDAARGQVLHVWVEVAPADDPDDVTTLHAVRFRGILE